MTAVDWAEKAARQHARPSDPALDFCLWPYEPPKAAGPDALRSAALLYQSFTLADVGPKMAAICDALIDAWGRFQTVWGMKWGAAGPSWEFYFYDYDRANRRLGIADFLRSTDGLLNCDLPAPDDVPYFMFSVEVTPDHLDGAPLDQIDIYIGNPGSDVSSGICYGQTAKGRHLRNFYFFFDGQRHQKDIVDKLTESAYLPQTGLDLDQMIWPEMRSAQTIVVANKQTRDSLYFSRINAKQLARFLHRLHFPNQLRDYLAENHDKLDHHLYDVGWDYDIGGSGEIIPVKGSFYGLL
ncbi:MAG: hypothetical protein AAGA05_00450 [Pseudomonadota bacterium]